VLYFQLFASDILGSRWILPAIWTFIISGLFLLAGAYVTMAGLCSMDALMQCSG
jgi:hypothetical protein